MGISLQDRETKEFGFSINFWHWRPLVELIRTLGVVDNATVDSLHEPFQGNGLSKDEARKVAAAFRSQVLPDLAPAKWVGLSQQQVDERPPGTHGFTNALLRGDDLSHNYWTNREAIVEFVEYLESCNGFDVL